MLDESIDPEIVIPKMADTRKTYRENIPDFKNQLDSFSGYDAYSDDMVLLLNLAQTDWVFQFTNT